MLFMFHLCVLQDLFACCLENGICHHCTTAAVSHTCGRQRLRTWDQWETESTLHLQGVILFDIGNKQWTLDLSSGNGSIKEGESDEDADVTLSMSGAVSE